MLGHQAPPKCFGSQSLQSKMMATIEVLSNKIQGLEKCMAASYSFALPVFSPPLAQASVASDPAQAVNSSSTLNQSGAPQVMGPSICSQMDALQVNVMPLIAFLSQVPVPSSMCLAIVGSRGDPILAAAVAQPVSTVPAQPALAVSEQPVPEAVLQSAPAVTLHLAPTTVLEHDKDQQVGSRQQTGLGGSRLSDQEDMPALNAAS